MKRRDFLKSAGLVAAGTMLSPKLMAGEVSGTAADIFNPEIQGDGNLNEVFPSRSLRADVNKPVTVAIIGLGNRGNVYARYSRKFPHAMKIVALADVNKVRLKSMGDEYDVPVIFFSFDALSSETGIKTRLEAFYDMLEMRKGK